MKVPLAKTLFGIIFLLDCIDIALHAQGTFGNLDFEAANVPVVPTGQFGADVTVAQGLPGWNATPVNVSNNTIGHNTVSLGGPVVAIEGPQWDSSQILQGQYSAYLVGAFNGGGSGSAAIWQTGLVPQNAKSLYFIAAPFLTSPGPIFQVTLGGVSIPITETASTSKYSVWGGDISAFAGLPEELRFTALPGHGGFLDDIVFSTTPVPEPTNPALLVIGGLVLRTLKRKA